MMKTVVDLFYEKEDLGRSNTSGRTIDQSSGNSNKSIEDQSLDDLMKLYEMYMTNFKFHKENGTLSEEREKSMIEKIDKIFEIIEDRTSNNKRARSNSDNDNNVVS